MAKKVIISANIPSLSQAWGGTNGTGAAQTILGTSVPAGAQWALDFEKIEDLIKAQFGTKAGAFRTTSPDANNYIHILCFATAADAALYDSDSETYASLVIQNLTIPISTVQSDSYAAVLSADRGTSSNYVVKSGDSFDVNMRYQSLHIIAATNTTENYSANGTLTVERSVDGGSTWAQVAKQTVRPSEVSAADYPIALALGDYLVADRANQIRVRASFKYTDDDNVERTRSSSYVTYVVNCVSLSVELASQWERPVTIASGTSQLPLRFTVYGAVAKTLHVEVDGAVSTAIWTGNYDATHHGSTEDVYITETTATKILNHGVRQVRAWLTCSDGDGGTLTSDVAVNHLMIVNESTAGADLTQPYLLLQGLASSVPNFVQSRICSYAVYSPSGANIDIALLLTSASGSILTVSQTEHFRLETSAAPQTQYDLDVTVEIEQAAGETVADTLDAFFHVTRNNGGTTVDFLEESMGAGYQYIAVDNSAGYAPTAGSDFLLNPKTRNNTEADPARILNARNGGSVVASEWSGFKFGTLDGWTVDEAGNKVLRVPAGCLLNIKYNPLAQFLASPASSMTMEMDVCVRNVTNEDDPIVRLCEQLLNGNYIGLRMRPMVGTLTTASNPTEETTDFRWQEDERVHISINIRDAVSPNVILNNVGDGLTAGGSTTTGTIALVRVFINGIINRELRFDRTSASEFCTAALSNGGIYIGQDGADIDIYGIRVWENRSLSAANILQNYVSTLPSSEEKQRVKAENAIMTSNRIDIDKVRAIGKRVLVWHGQEPWHGNTNSLSGWWEFWQYDDEGNELPELSGTICRETGSLKAKRQGTTANTYYYSNIQTKLGDVTATINVPLSDLHSSITQGATSESDGVTYIALSGGNLGKNFPAAETAVNYPLVTVDGVQCVTVPDGWVDGNGKYRGMGYTVADGLPLAQKLVLKINYASSMQSHIVGVNRLYNDLHTAYVGANKLQQATEGALVAKHLEPFLFFTQASDNDAPIYRGPGTWGPGKMDKPTWGYVKSVFPNFTMIEGADNSKELTDMRVPFDDVPHGSDAPKVYYSPDNEAWMYRLHDGTAQKCINFDTGKTYDVAAGDIDSTHLYAGEYPHQDIVAYIKAAWNFLYLHNPRIKCYDGSYSAFLASSAANDHNTKYWCRSAGGNDANDYKLKRWDFTDGAWVDAGLWNGSAYDEVDLMDASSLTYAAYSALSTNEKADYTGAVNNAFIAAIVQDAKSNIGNYFVEKSLKFHYVFQNHFIAGTDNCSKNTYYVLVPTTGSAGSWGGWKFELHQDDVDTVLATDNSGLQTKPYYIDRMHPYADSDTNHANCLYEGVNNVLFNLCEEMWEDSLELADALREILVLMAGLNASRTGTAASAGMAGVWGTLNKYIFDVQRYIPAMAFNEAARIRYEFPAMTGYVSDQRQVDPIEQSMGDQLQSELQWMKRRLVYMASYASFGEFRPQGSGSTGLSDVSDSFAMVMAALPNGDVPSFTFTLTPHQYIYPTAANAQSLINPHVRVSPAESYTMTVNPTQSSDDGVTIYGINYYRSVGNIGDNSFKPTQTFTLNGKRLVSFTAEPTKWYPTAETLAVNPSATYRTEPTAGYLPAFRCSGVTVNATRLQSFSMKGCTSVGGGALNLSVLARVATIDLRGTDITAITVPATSTLTALRLPAGLTALSLTAQPQLSTLSLEGGTALQSLTVTGCASLSTQALVRQLYDERLTAGTLTPLSVLNIDNVDWSDFMADALVWVASAAACTLRGKVVMLRAANDRWLTFSEVIHLIRKFGDIQTVPTGIPTDRLYIDYQKRDVNGVAITGEKYIYTLGTRSEWSAAATNDVGNNIAVRNGREAVTFTLVEAAASEYAVITDAVEGTVNIKKTYSYNEYRTFTLRMSVTLLDGTTMTVDKKVGFHKRLPKIGDFAYADGNFDDEFDPSKELVGAIVKIDVLSASQRKLWVYAKENVQLQSTDGTYNTSSHVWGIFPDESAANGFPSSVYNEIAQEAGLSNAVDTAMANLTSSGITSPTDASNKDYRYINDASFHDATQDDGYSVLTGGSCSDFATEEKNEIVINHAKAIINGYLGESYPTTPTELADAIQALVEQMSEQGASNLARYRQLFYPATFACHVYEPNVAGTLDAQYARNRWLLPTCGLLSRIYNFFYNSCGHQTYENGGRCVAANANEAPDSEALLPLFANILKRVADAGVTTTPFNIPTNSLYWSVTEPNSTTAGYVHFGSGHVTYGSKYSSLVVRPVAAFTYDI